MLSRASILAVQQSRVLTSLNIRATQTACGGAVTPTKGAPTTGGSSSGGERDLVNFPRPVRPLESGKVRLGLIPDEWFQFFYKKTGVTGPYTFGVGLITYLCSKEIYVMEHEYYTGLSIAIMAVIAVKKVGPALAAYIDKEVENYENSWNEGREMEKSQLTTAIKDEKTSQWQADGQLTLIEAKKENVLLQLEAAYRERLMTAYREVKRRLDYQLAKEHVESRIAQKHMVQWIVSKVLSSITTEQEKETLNKCIADLANLAKVA